MAEFLSPNPSMGTKQRAPMASRLQSPTSPFFLGSNDDQLERAQARAARAAAIRRKSTPARAPSPPHDPCFSKQQISELFQNCIKLASENKINQKNTWELNLIDHLSELIKVEAEEDDVETNFQKASCTLEAGVKIYALRVDSVHSEAYKVLGGINRAGREDAETIVDGECINNEQDEGRIKKEQERKMSPISTLESSFEALNVKKFDVAFAVDPLYHQTSAQFDEGGAKGLLLNNLGVYGDCRVVFDSLEVPGKCMSCAPQSDKSDTIDISFAREYIEQMATNMSTKNEISPSLRIIVSQFDDYNQRPSDTFSGSLETMEQADVFGDNQADLDDDAFENCGSWSFDHDDQASVVDETSNNTDPSFPSHQEDNDSFRFHEPDISDRFEKVTDFMLFGLGFTSNQNAWAGPDHWKFRKAKGRRDVSVAENGSAVTTKRPKNKKQAEFDIDFTKSLDSEMPDIFAAPKNPKSLLLPANRVRCNTTLPEDCHYRPEDLVKLFLLPNVMCLGKRGRKQSDESRCDGDFGPVPSWDNESVFSGQFDDGNVHSDVDDSSTLVSHPRQVHKIEVQYDKTSKQVDVHVLKGTLWNHMQESVETPVMGCEATVSFSQVLASFPDDCQAAAPEDISPHLCFICLLHLANEHGLRILDNPNLDDLQIHIPMS
ncbi:Condensin complex subunit 2/barren [Macleaya cordata]|uniref:Condensin complex subunit 2 n=1 Tax=Macleaya cordata TaxID=56857 RepID=A0A200PYV7_MACCD|nr:Condensin complex subunit 2/barren [Macleaya cordata]